MTHRFKAESRALSAGYTNRDSEPDACPACLSVSYNEKGIIHFFDCPKHGDNPPHVTFSGHER